MKFLILALALVASASSHPTFGTFDIPSISHRPAPIVEEEHLAVPMPAPIYPDVMPLPAPLLPEGPLVLPNLPTIITPLPVLPNLPIVISPLPVLPNLPIIAKPLPIIPEGPQTFPMPIPEGPQTIPMPIPEVEQLPIEVPVSSPLVQIIVNIVSDKSPESLVDTVGPINIESGILKPILELPSAPIDMTRPVIGAPIDITRPVIEAPAGITRPILELPVAPIDFTRPVIEVPAGITRPVVQVPAGITRPVVESVRPAIDLIR